MLSDAEQARALLAPILVHTFQDLDVGASLRADVEWYPLYVARNVVPFELELGVEARRFPYNEGCLAKAISEKKTVLGEHAGFCDFFVPVFDRSAVRAVMVVGPFARERATGAAIYERWRWLTGSDPRSDDPRLLAYVERNLATLVLDADTFGLFRRHLECLAATMGGQKKVDALTAEAFRVRTLVERARLCESMWAVASGMISPQSAHVWERRYHADDLERVGASSFPDHALAGLLAPATSDLDAVENAVRRDGFQRAAVELARKVAAGAVCGRLWDLGVFLLVPATGGVARRKAKLADLGGRLATLARRFGFRLHVGIGPIEAATHVERYEGALRAAQASLSEGLSRGLRGSTAENPSAWLRRALGRVAESQEIYAAFERYVAAATISARGHDELLGLELQVGLERLLENLQNSGAIDAPGAARIERELDGALRTASGSLEIVAQYRAAVERARAYVARPTEANRKRSLERAVAFMQQHLDEPLTLTKVARSGGFAPGYFSRLLKREHRLSFELYLRALRVARARELLHDTQLPILEVGRRSGFGKRGFHQVFKQEEGMTPLAYREKGWWSGASAHDFGKPRHAPGRRKRR